MLTERYSGLSFKFFLHFSMRDHYKGEIFRLNSENEKLREDLDALEQYGRRELMRINGIPDGGQQETTYSGLSFKFFLHFSMRFFTLESLRRTIIWRGGKARPCSPTLTGFPILCDRMISDSLRSGSMDLIRSVTSLGEKAHTEM
jgi:hypothetical protein